MEEKECSGGGEIFGLGECGNAGGVGSEKISDGISGGLILN